MGIKDFYKIIKRKCPEELLTLDLYDLSGISVAVDISVFLYKLIKTAGDRWRTSFVILLCTLKRYKIKCVCIFDGPDFPPEKIQERERRRRQAQKDITRMENCKRMRDVIRDRYIGPDKDAWNADIKEECKNLIGTRRKGWFVDMDKPGFVCDALTEVIERLTKQTAPITPEHTEEAKEIVKSLGLACYHSPGEAETLCSYLAIKGYVTAVLTEDTDVMAYGTPIMLAFKDFKPGEGKIYGMVLKTILEKLELNLEEFRDLCILLSCDYNERAKLPPIKAGSKPRGVGLVKSLELIEEYRRIENMEDILLDTTHLNYKRCRELFTIPAYEDVFDLRPFNTEPDYAALEELVERYTLGPRILDYVRQSYSPSNLIFEESE